MKKLLILPFIFLSNLLCAQVVVLTPKGVPASIDTSTKSLRLVGNYVIGTCDTCISFDSTKVVTNLTKNATNDSFQVYRGETLFSTLKDNVGTSVDSLKHLPVDTSVRRNGYFLTFDSTNHKWYLSAGTAGGGSGITVTSYGKNATRDSTILIFSDGTRFAAKDSVNTYWLPTTGGIYSAAGKHGINTSTPQNDLDIKGTANSWMLNVGNDLSTGTGWAGISLGESFGASAVRKTGLVYRRTGSAGEGDVAIISKRSGSGNATYTDVHTNFADDGSVVINNGYNKNYFSILSIYDTSKGFKVPVHTSSQISRNSSGVVTLSVITGGIGYTGSAFTASGTTGGSGTGLQLSGTISGGAVTSAAPYLSNIGVLYKVGDTVYSNFNSGTGASFLITSTGSKGNVHFDSSTNQLAIDHGNGIVTGFFTSSSASSLTLQYGNDYVFTGSTATYTLPSVSSNTLGRQNSIIIKNRGSGTITLNSASGAQIYTTSAQTSISIAAGGACELLPGGSYFNVLYNQ